MDYIDFNEMRAQMVAECAHSDETEVTSFIYDWFGNYEQDFVFTMTPGAYIPYAYDQIIDKVIMSDTHALLEKLKILGLDETTFETFKVICYYITSTAMPNEVAKHPLKEDKNCFVTSFNVDMDKRMQNGFTKIPTTLFGRKPIAMFNWALPAHKNFALVYNKDALRVAAFQYQGKAFMPWQGFVLPEA